MSIGARFLKIRKQRGLNQADVAVAIGVSHGALVNYEKGLRDPTAAAIVAFCQTYQVNPVWLLLGEGRPGKDEIGQLYQRSIRIAWAYLMRGGDEVDPEELITIGNSLFHYLIEHGDISEAMTENILALRA
jgi:transcriptional regulator with XRE-family HTH domain